MPRSQSLFAAFPASTSPYRCCSSGRFIDWATIDAPSSNQTILALVVLPLSYLCSNPRENVNWVYGFGETPQSILPAPIFLLLLMVLFPIVIYLPTHFLFAKIFHSPTS